MPNDTFGQSAFTQEELDNEAAEEAKRKAEQQAKLEAGFFVHGENRPVYLDNIVKEEKIAQSGKPYTARTYWLRDADTGQKELVDTKNHGFAFRNALEPVKKELGTSLRLGITKLNVFTEKTGEREYNGFQYPIYKFTITVLENDDKKAVPPPIEADPNEIKVEDIPF